MPPKRTSILPMPTAPGLVIRPHLQQGVVIAQPQPKVRAAPVAEAPAVDLFGSPQPTELPAHGRKQLVPAMRPTVKGHPPSRPDRLSWSESPPVPDMAGLPDHNSTGNHAAAVLLDPWGNVTSSDAGNLTASTAPSWATGDTATWDASESGNWQSSGSSEWDTGDIGSGAHGHADNWAPSGADVEMEEVSLQASLNQSVEGEIAGGVAEDENNLLGDGGQAEEQQPVEDWEEPLEVGGQAEEQQCEEDLEDYAEGVELNVEMQEAEMNGEDAGDLDPSGVPTDNAPEEGSEDDTWGAWTPAQGKGTDQPVTAMQEDGEMEEVELEAEDDSWGNWTPASKAERPTSSEKTKRIKADKNDDDDTWGTWTPSAKAAVAAKAQPRLIRGSVARALVHPPDNPLKPMPKAKIRAVPKLVVKQEEEKPGKSDKARLVVKQQEEKPGKSDKAADAGKGKSVEGLPPSLASMQRPKYSVLKTNPKPSKAKQPSAPPPPHLLSPQEVPSGATGAQHIQAPSSRPATPSVAPGQAVQPSSKRSPHLETCIKAFSILLETKPGKLSLADRDLRAFMEDSNKALVSEDEKLALAMYLDKLPTTRRHGIAVKYNRTTKTLYLVPAAPSANTEQQSHAGPSMKNFSVFGGPSRSGVTPPTGGLSQPSHGLQLPKEVPAEEHVAAAPSRKPRTPSPRRPKESSIRQEETKQDEEEPQELSLEERIGKLLGRLDTPHGGSSGSQSSGRRKEDSPGRQERGSPATTVMVKTPAPAHELSPTVFINPLYGAGGKSLGGQLADELVRELVTSFGLAYDDFDESHHFVYKEGREYRKERGGERFQPPPAGSVKLALRVLHKYEALSGSRGVPLDTWLDRNGGWPVAYHGTNADGQAIKGIVREGLKVRGGQDAPRVGERFGTGVYVSPDPHVAASFCDQPLVMVGSPHLPHLQGKSYHLVVQCRVRPGAYELTGASRAAWLVPKEDDVRPCGLLLLASKSVHCRHGKRWFSCCGASQAPTAPILEERRSRSRRRSGSRSRRRTRRRRSRSCTRSCSRTRHRRRARSLSSSSSSSSSGHRRPRRKSHWG